MGGYFKTLAFLVFIMPKASLSLPLIIDLHTRSTVSNAEALIKDHFIQIEQRIAIASHNTRQNEVRSREQAKELLSITIGNEMTKAYKERPVFRLPTRESNQTAHPLCGTEAQQLACALLIRNTDGRVFFSPFDLDQLVSRRWRWRTTHRHSPLNTIVRICSGLKAQTRYLSKETCVAPLILRKLLTLVDDYNVMVAQKSVNDNHTEPVFSVVSFNRYLTVKSLLKNYGYARDGTAAEHTTGNAIDILCGPSAGINGGAEKNCSTISKLCSATSASDALSPAEPEGCGNASSPLTSVHCSFYSQPRIDLAAMTTTEVTEAIHAHYAPFRKQTQLAVSDVAFNTAKQAIAQNLTLANAVKIASRMIIPKLNKIIKVAHKNRVIFQTSPVSPSWSMRFQYNGRSQALLQRRSRSTQDAAECPAASVELANQLMDLHNSGNVLFAWDSMANTNLTALVSNQMAKQNHGQPTAKVTTPNKSTRSVSIEADIANLAKGYKAQNSDGNKTCISYETLLAIKQLAHNENLAKPLHIAALAATRFHASTSEALSHNAGVSVDLLCGEIYDGQADSIAHCTTLISACFLSNMVVTADISDSTACLKDSVLQNYGIIHCRSR